MINITNKDKTNYRQLSEYEVSRFVKYAHAYAFRQVGDSAWEVDYFREKTARNWKSPKYTHPDF